MIDKPFNRRGFFRSGLFELLKPLGQALAPMQKVMEELNRLDEPLPDPPKPEKHWLRPPGSLDEQRFREQCTRSGECVRVCPARAIKIDYGFTDGEGVPYIDANESACVLCTGLLCMYACPSGALQPVLIDYIDMGIAVWNESYCLRSAGQDCTICVDTCPVGAKAIVVEGARIDVHTGGCTGCGECQHECPTSPKAITVRVKSER